MIVRFWTVRVGADENDGNAREGYREGYYSNFLGGVFQSSPNYFFSTYQINVSLYTVSAASSELANNDAVGRTLGSIRALFAGLSLLFMVFGVIRRLACP